MKTKFTKAELSELTGLTSRRLLDWTTRGYLVPAEKVEGRGKTSYYDLANAIQAKVLERLSESGITLSRFAAIFHGSQIEKQFSGLADYFFSGLREVDSFDFREIIYSVVVIDDCRIVRLTQTEINEDLKLKMRNGGDLPGIEDFWQTVLIINLNQILSELRRNFAIL